MGSFIVDSYKTRLEITRSGNPVVTGRTRVIELASTVQFHGIIERAVLAFSTSWDNWSVTPAVGYYDTSSPFQPRLTGWLPSAEFSLWYDVLRSEKPVTCFYTITPINGADYVSTIAIGTSTEPLGEGPADLSP